jgi:hypothetical protein
VIREAREYFVEFRTDCIGHANFAALDLGTYADFYVEALLEGHREATSPILAAGGSSVVMSATGCQNLGA